MLGCDIIGLERVRKVYSKYGEALLDRILTDGERAIFFTRNESMSFLAGRFAAKEAISKAFKTGIGALGFTDIEILPDENGAPVVYIRGALAPELEISISHCKEYAMAVCLHNRQL
ncbi:MAG: holo-ACP synthase [Deferribacteraceae bacterium]|jgi:holo-[acyl-carrier protein] synthase|nr:holo-ACP synthase [Deferribacteraceae bacterium]